MLTDTWNDHSKILSKAKIYYFKELGGADPLR